MSVVLKSQQYDEIILIDVVEENSMSGLEWLQDIESRGTKVHSKARKIIRSIDKLGVDVGKKLAIFKTEHLKDEDRTTRSIEAKIFRHGLFQTTPGAVCFLEKILSGEEFKKMGLWQLVGIHKPLVLKGKKYNLSFGRSDLDRSVSVCRYDPDHQWKTTPAFICEMPN